MAQGSQTLTTYYAKRIIGDSAAATADKALLQTGNSITANTWILNRTSRLVTSNNSISNFYGIKYTHDNSNSDDKIELYGGHLNNNNEEESTAWIGLNTGNIYILGKVGINSNPNNSYYLYVNGATYLNGATTITGITSITNATGLNGTNNTGALTVTGGVYLNEKIKVNGTSWLVGHVGIGIDADSTYNLYINGTTWMADNLYFSQGKNIYMSYNSSN